MLTSDWCRQLLYDDSFVFLCSAVYLFWLPQAAWDIPCWLVSIASTFCIVFCVTFVHIRMFGTWEPHAYCNVTVAFSYAALCKPLRGATGGCGPEQRFEFAFCYCTVHVHRRVFVLNILFVSARTSSCLRPFVMISGLRA